ncbi:conserved hypothetical protein [Coccidioides posadasii str. Silveira]|uniref:Uncharacterized protein n=1 Tax=Coccidioides posadasii (strain RMSCC 757 / Silveira) TaxID=443226 RepID=E9CS87_COCPS|nr:conserved hypothetical protein [Coccidioides posadasii str. Silveira]
MCSLLYALFASAVIATPLGGDNVMKRQGFDGPVNPGRRQIAVGTVLLKMRFSPVHTLKSNGSSLTTNLWPGRVVDTRSHAFFDPGKNGRTRRLLLLFIAEKFGWLSVWYFITWNPAVKDDCSALWAGYYYCTRDYYRGDRLDRGLLPLSQASHLFTSSGAHSGSMLDFSRRLRLLFSGQLSFIS